MRVSRDDAPRIFPPGLNSAETVFPYNHYKPLIMETKEIVAKNDLKIMSLLEFANANGIVRVVPIVRENENGYPYVTFVGAKTEQTQNVYFSKSASKNVAAGMTMDRDAFKAYQIGFTTNAEGEERIKLVCKTEDVEDLFGED